MQSSGLLPFHILPDFLFSRGHSSKLPSWKTPAGHHTCQPLDLRVPSLQTVRNKGLFFINYLISDILLYSTKHHIHFHMILTGIFLISNSIKVLCLFANFQSSLEKESKFCPILLCVCVFLLLNFKSSLCLLEKVLCVYVLQIFSPCLSLLLSLS